MTIADGQPRVMVVDDDVVFRELVRVLLEKNGYQVTEASDGARALKLCDEQQCDVLLVDLNMPVMSGLDLLAEIGRQGRYPPVIVVSGTGEVTDVAKALRLGAWDFLFKPIDDNTIFFHSINSVVQRARLLKENRDYQILLEQKVEQKTNEISEVNSRLQEVVESTKRLLSCGELKQSGKVILEEFGRHMNARGGSIYQVVSGGLEHLYSLDPGHAEPFLPFPLKENSLFARALASTEPFFVTNLEKDDTCRGSGWPHYGDNSILFFPIVDAVGKTIAIIALHNKNEPPFVSQDREIGSILASYASEVLQTAQMQLALKKNEEIMMHAQKMEAIGTLAGGIAHDFNNILSAIIGYTDLSLYTGALAPNIKNNLEQIRKASNRAKDLVKQILSFSRAEQCAEESADIAPIIKEALKLLRAIIPSTIGIESQVQAGLGKVKVDPTRVHQIVMNLCSNAIHAMGDGSGLVSVVFERLEKKNYPADLTEIKTEACLCLSVGDNGAGIDRDVLPRIFDPYFTTKPKGEGTGLGLAVVHGILAHSGGAIRVLSEPKMGSVFRLYFPAVPESQETVRPLVAGGIPGGNERILFVDDEAGLAEVAREMLVRLGYEVQIKTSGVTALQHLRLNPDRYQLLITDQTMPELSGIDLARQVLILQPKLPVILYTGYSTAIDGPEARQAGVKAFLMKPLSMAKLAVVVRQVLDGDDVPAS